MTDKLTCELVTETGMVERYVAETLPDSELEGFEDHLLLCQRCQEEVVQAVAVREALRETTKEGSGREASAGNPEKTRTGFFFGIPPKIWLPVAAAAGVAGLVFFGPDRVPGAIRELGGVSQPPIYLGISVRQDPASADSLFDAAMLRYVVDEFGDAAKGLEEALEAGAPPVPAQFFLGASQLTLDRPREAAEAFGVVIDSGSSPYLAEAHYYRAKAHLRRGEVEAALADLRAASAIQGEISRSAEALADSLEVRLGG